MFPFFNFVLVKRQLSLNYELRILSKYQLCSMSVFIWCQIFADAPYNSQETNMMNEREGSQTKRPIWHHQLTAALSGLEDNVQPAHLWRGGGGKKIPLFPFSPQPPPQLTLTPFPAGLFKSSGATFSQIWLFSVRVSPANFEIRFNFNPLLPRMQKIKICHLALTEWLNL